jgi:hypothetical protein
MLVSVATGSAAATPAGLAGGIGDAFLVASFIAAAARVAATLLLPSRASFLPKLNASEPIPVH